MSEPTASKRKKLLQSLHFVRTRNGLFIVLLLLMAFTVTMTSVRRAHAASGPTLTVDATAASYPINPNIYGACGGNNLDANFAREISLPLCRWGGDATTRYNWQVNASNSGSDFWFLGSASNLSADQFIDNNYTVGANSMITIPMIPYIEKSVDNLCAFSVKKYGWDNVGGFGAFWFDFNGQGPNGHDGHYDCAFGVDTTPQHHNFTGNDPHDTSTENSPDIQKAWVQHLVQRYGPSSQSHILYELDNEPSNWGYLHRDVYRPYPTSYDDLINYTEQYASAIKSADPSAQVVGPNDLGFAWQGNDANMIKYLQAMQQYEQQHGQRILDIFSEHYPGATNGDIDHIRKLVDQYYPGTGIGFDEWNQGGDPVATASTLGQFARDRVSEAAYWTLQDPGEPASQQAYAFRMFRNYDGQGSQFGDTYLQSTSSNDSQLSVYGAKRSSDGAITIIVTNPTDTDLSSPLNLNGINPSGNARVYTYASKSNATTIIRQPDQSVSSSGLTYTYPAHSITLVAIPTGNGFTVDGNGAVGTGTGLSGVYYNSTDLSGEPVAVRTDPQINFTWDGNTSPAPGVTPQNFSVRWNGQVQPTISGNYTFSTVSDDGIRLWVNGQKVIDDWSNHPPTTDTSASIFLVAGAKYWITIEYFNGCCGAAAQLSWTPPNQSQQLIPTSQLYSTGSGTGLTGAYYNSTDYSTPVVTTRTDGQINFSWDGTTPPAPGVYPQGFAVHWTGQLLVPASGSYQFVTTSNAGGTRLWVNGQLVIDKWGEPTGPKSGTSAPIFLTAGKYSINMDYYDNCCSGAASLQWIPPGAAQQLIPTSQLYPTGSGWTKCSDEGGTCTFTGTQVVRYGANGKYVYQTATGSIGCNNGVFGDPIPGTFKACSTTPVPPTSWTKCSDENGTCTVPGTVTVAYGANGNFVYQTVSGSTACNNTTFGDPTPGTFKACYYQ